MEDILEDKLQEIYENLKIEVVYRDIRKYWVIVTIEHNGVEYESKIEYTYNVKLTVSANIRIIEDIIDKQILIPFYKEKGE